MNIMILKKIYKKIHALAVVNIWYNTGVLMEKQN